MCTDVDKHDILYVMSESWTLIYDKNWNLLYELLYVMW